MPYADAMLFHRSWEEDGPPLRISFARFVGYNGKREFEPSDISQILALQSELANDAGRNYMPTAKMPQRFKESIRYAEEMKKKMGITPSL
jgi:hypothetical protein